MNGPRAPHAFPQNCLAPAIAALLLVLCSCAAGTHMVAKDPRPALTARSDRAVLVIVRTSIAYGGYGINNYLDGKLIGQTQGKSYFMTDVKPGTHYLMSRADNIDTARLKFEAGRIYFLQQGIYPGWDATARFSPMTPDDAKLEIQEASYLVYDRQKPGGDLPGKDYDKAKDDFDKENLEDPTQHKDILDYRGYKPGK
jgi:uncharacterized protein DUF2846